MSTIETLIDPDQQVRTVAPDTADRTSATPDPFEPTLHRWSLDQYYELIETGVLENQRVELFDGEIVNMSPQSGSHYASVRKTFDSLRKQVKSPQDVFQQRPADLKPETQREPDVSVLTPDESDVERFDEPIDFVIEVSLTTLHHDRTDKASLYARNQIPTYWIVNLIDRTVEVRSEPAKSESGRFGWDYAKVETYPEMEFVPLPFEGAERIAVADLLPPAGTDIGEGQIAGTPDTPADQETPKAD